MLIAIDVDVWLMIIMSMYMHPLALPEENDQDSTSDAVHLINQETNGDSNKTSISLADASSED